MTQAMTYFGFRISDRELKKARTTNPPSAIRHPPLTRRGFTLLELVVAMSLMVVVSSCLYSALYTGFRAYRSAQAAVDPTAAAINVIELIKQDIGGVLPPGGTLAGAFIGTDSGGLKGVDADSLEFYTTHVYANDARLDGRTTTAAPLVGGIGKVALLLEEDSEEKDGTYLLLRQVTTDLLAPREMEPEEQVLCRGVASLNFRYYDGTGWVDSWDSTTDSNSLPLAVEVDIQIARKDKYNSNSKELQKRRLVQSFAIACKTETTESDTTTSAASTSTSTKSSTPTGGTSAPATGGTTPKGASS
ncbi:MAG: prepilin-type N-terminal cleavage/methylation domain-containing protein [Planctomycetes bacterium]|nr:prepilin-type N-terminal cleavage/methylation domain-containing protein [Planctomycetota bacterium]